MWFPPFKGKFCESLWIFFGSLWNWRPKWPKIDKISDQLGSVDGEKISGKNILFISLNLCAKFHLNLTMISCDSWPFLHQKPQSFEFHLVLFEKKFAMQKKFHPKINIFSSCATVHRIFISSNLCSMKWKLAHLRL